MWTTCMLGFSLPQPMGPSTCSGRQVRWLGHGVYLCGEVELCWVATTTPSSPTAAAAHELQPICYASSWKTNPIYAIFRCTSSFHPLVVPPSPPCTALLVVQARPDKGDVIEVMPTEQLMPSQHTQLSELSQLAREAWFQEGHPGMCCCGVCAVWCGA